jgi:CubicO group peptidase (beta-lactamase class C family)
MTGNRWDVVAKALADGAAQGVFPGGVLGVVVKSQPPRIFAAGRTAYTTDSSVVTEQTYFDLASLTKVLFTTSVAARLCDRNKIDLTSRVVEGLPDLPWHPEWGEITVRDLLAHQAGFEAWVNFARELDLSKTKPASKAARRFILETIASKAPVYPPHTQTRYSDLGFMVLGEWLARAGAAETQALFETEVRSPLQVKTLTHEPLREKISKALIAATEDVGWRGGMIQGEPHDDNAYLLGGLPGHAGLFGTVRDCLTVGVAWRDACLSGTGYLSKPTARMFISRQVTSKGDPRALGWDLPAKEHSSAGSRISGQALGHLGYTGTSFWIDLEREAVVVLLTNRVHPSAKNEKIKAFRPLLHDRVWEAIDG